MKGDGKMENRTFVVVLDRGMHEIVDFVEAESLDEARSEAHQLASELCSRGLDTVVVAVFEHGDDDEEPR
jgi:hypothetical protein